MMECGEEFVDSDVLEAVQQRTDKIKIARKAKVEALRRKEMEEEEQAWQRKEEQEEQAQQRKNEQEEQACQRKNEQEEQALQQKKEQEEQAPKVQGKYKTFDNRMEDLTRYKETHGHVNVSIPEDKSLTKFCTQTRHARKNPGKSKRKQLTN
jgi:hypothetical protein